MSTDNPLKSAVELAMERLRKRDEESGVTAPTLTNEQKAAIAEVRSIYEAKIAEQDVLYRSKLAGMHNLAEREQLENEFRVDRERLSAERNAKIEKIRRGD
jgi:hypothetical protein